MLRNFNEVERFTVGTVGVPGDRTFFLQIRSGNTILSTSIEKSQVAAMSERIQYMLKEKYLHPHYVSLLSGLRHPFHTL